MGMSTKKAAQDHPQDWHAADVVAALHKRNVSLRQLAAKHGYSHIQRVLTSPWLAAEQIVARALEMRPEEIWPSRYADAGARNRAALLTRKYQLAAVSGKSRRTQRAAA